MKKKLSGFNKFMLIYISVLCAVMLVLSIMERCGLSLIMAESVLLGCILVVVSLAVWGAVALYRIIGNKTLRIVAGLLMAFVIVLLGSYAAAYVMQFGQLALPHEFATVMSASGEKVVVLAAVDTGMGSEETYDATMARMDARREAICAAAGEEVDPEEYPRGAFGYAYTVYPKVMGLFYNKNADSQGVIYRGCESEAKLLYEWSDDSVRFYLENPEVGDEGEILLRR